MKNLHRLNLASHHHSHPVQTRPGPPTPRHPALVLSDSAHHQSIKAFHTICLNLKRCLYALKAHFCRQGVNLGHLLRDFARQGRGFWTGQVDFVLYYCLKEIKITRLYHHSLWKSSKIHHCFGGRFAGRRLLRRHSSGRVDVVTIKLSAPPSLAPN